MKLVEHIILCGFFSRLDLFLFSSNIQVDELYSEPLLTVSNLSFGCPILSPMHWSYLLGCINNKYAFRFAVVQRLS